MQSASIWKYIWFAKQPNYTSSKQAKMDNNALSKGMPDNIRGERARRRVNQLVNEIWSQTLIKDCTFHLIDFLLFFGGFSAIVLAFTRNKPYSFPGVVCVCDICLCVCLCVCVCVCVCLTFCYC